MRNETFSLKLGWLNIRAIKHQTDGALVRTNFTDKNDMNDILKIEQNRSFIKQTIDKENLVTKVHMPTAYYSQ